MKGTTGAMFLRRLMGKATVVPSAAAFCLAAWLATGLVAEESLLDQLSSALVGPQRQMVVRIVDEAGEPMAGASLNVRIDSSETNYQSDPNGQIKVRLPEKDPPYLRLRANARGYVRRGATWSNRESKDPVPAEFTIPMQRGISIGGVVRNEAGEPIEGAKLELSLSLKEPAQGRVWSATSGYEARTNAQGQWRLDDMPKDLARVVFRLDHPDYISDSRLSHRPTAPVDQLVDMTAAVVMKKGIAVEGTVTDPEGAPVAGATIAQGADRVRSDYPKTTTNAKGRYRFAHCNPGPTVLTVVAKGWSPDLRQVSAHAGMGPIDFQLKKGRTLRVRAVDTAGKPIAGVWVAPDTWRGHRTLTGLGVPRETNADGLWVWDWAPHDTMLVSVFKQGYMSLHRQSLTAREEEYVITLRRPFTVSGRVVDAETKEAVKAFRIVPGIDWDREGGSPYWRRSRMKGGKDGAYSWQFSQRYPKYLVKIEADGYLPGISRPFSADEGKATFDFELVPGVGPEGVVLDHEGNPVQGAQVYLCSKSSRPYVRNGRNIHDREAIKAKTDAEGKFRLPPQTEPYSLLVLHDVGYAEVTEAGLAQASEIRLVRWARVEGMLQVGSGPGVQKEVSLYVERPREDRDVPQPYFHYDATTDAQGRFTFERALPGKARIYRMIRFAVRESGFSAASSHGIRVKLEPGKTTNVEMGGTGRPIEGRVVLPEGEDEPIDWNFAIGRLSPSSAEIPYPDNFQEMDPEAQQAWYQAWQESDAYQEYLKAREERVTYAFNLQADGSFRCEDVPAGAYKLSTEVYEPPPPNQ